LVKSDKHKNMGGSLVAHDNKKNELSEKVDNEFLLRYFQENDIKEISLTHEGNLQIEKNSGETKIINIINDEQVSLELQKVIDYYQKSGRTSLSQEVLIDKDNVTDLPTTNPKNNHALLIGLGIGGVLIIGVVIGLWLRKSKVKKG
jgi:hypothetical protein